MNYFNIMSKHEMSGKDVKQYFIPLSQYNICIKDFK